MDRLMAGRNVSAASRRGLVRGGRAKWRPDLEAGLISAILILPQAIALATLAGMPPEYGLYTSIFPVIIAGLFGSSWHTLSGPNTAVCVLIASAVAPFAAIGTDLYIGYVLALTLLAGAIQLAIGVTRLGTVLDFISNTVITGIVHAVALIIIVSAASTFLGVLSNPDERFFIHVYQLIHDLPRANGYAVTVGAITVATGLVFRHWWRRYALVVAVLVGALAGYALNLLHGPANTGLELLGTLSISLLPFSVPLFSLESLYVLKELVLSAFSIAFLGLMQTVVISRALAAKSGQHVDTNRDIVGQGLSNIIAPFLSAFASSGSFNRSAAHYAAGARTPFAGVYAALLLAAIVVAAAPLIAALPMAAVAGALMLVGLGLIDLKTVRDVMRIRREAFIFGLTFLAALVFGLNTGVALGILISLLFYLWRVSMPAVTTSVHHEPGGRQVQVVSFDGGLFFGAVRHVERVFAELQSSRQEASLLLLKTKHLTYLDGPGAALLVAEARRRRALGDEFVVHTSRSNIVDALRAAGLPDPDRTILQEQPVLTREAASQTWRIVAGTRPRHPGEPPAFE